MYITKTIKLFHNDNKGLSQCLKQFVKRIVARNTLCTGVHTGFCPGGIKSYILKTLQHEQNNEHLFRDLSFQKMLVLQF